jgi:hypothetical protein
MHSWRSLAAAGLLAALFACGLSHPSGQLKVPLADSPRRGPSDAWATVSALEVSNTMSDATLGGRFMFPGASLTVQRIGYGAMQLTGPGVWGAPKDPDGAVAVLREAVAAGVNHIDTADYYGPHITNQIPERSRHSVSNAFAVLRQVATSFKSTVELTYALRSSAFTAA